MKSTLNTYGHLMLALCFIAAAVGLFVVLPEAVLLVMIFLGCLRIADHWFGQQARQMRAPVIEKSAGLPDAAPYVSPLNPVECRVFRCGECCAPTGEPHAANCSQAATESLERAAAAIAELLPVASPFARSVSVDTTRLDLIESEKPVIQFFAKRAYVGGSYGDTFRAAIDKWTADRAAAGGPTT